MSKGKKISEMERVVEVTDDMYFEVIQKDLAGMWKNRKIKITQLPQGSGSGPAQYGDLKDFLNEGN